MADEELQSVIGAAIIESQELRKQLLWAPTDLDLLVRLESVTEELRHLGFLVTDFPGCDLITHPHATIRGLVLATEHRRRMSPQQAYERKLKYGRDR